MNRRLSSKKLRALLYYSQDGKCAICGCDLPDDWHADHVTPWSKVQRTNVHEMQALCPACNLRKGDSMLRKHQVAVRDILQRIATHTSKVRYIGAHVTPGGGKSGIAMLVAKELAEPLGYRICWVVPRDALRSQGEQDFVRKRQVFGHRSEIRAAGNDANPTRGTGGYVTTYQAVVQHPQLHQDEFRLRPYILILDECHHVPYLGESDDEEKAYFNAVAPLVDLAKIVVFMSGTLERHDGHRIAFWPYERFVTADSPVTKADETLPEWAFVRYTRKDALEEGAVVPLHFYALDGRAKWYDPKTNEERDVESMAESTKRDQPEVLKVVLETQYARQLLDKCVDDWKAHKGNVYRAAKLLAVAPGIEIAKEYATHLRALGLHTLIATSDDSQQARNNIEQFKRRADVLVTVGMAYEGLDVPEITHIACLTNIRSRSWIEQCICRANRTVEGKTHGFVYHPDEPRMNEIMKAIEAEQAAVVMDRPDSAWCFPPKGPTGPRNLWPIVPEGSVATRGRGWGLEDGTRVGYDESAVIEMGIKQANILGVSVVQMKQALVAMGLGVVPNGTAPLPNYDEPVTTPSEMEERLKKSIDRTVRRVAEGDVDKIKDINGELKRQFGPRIEASVPTLQTILRWLVEHYGKDGALV